ncbi:hypothetical protein K7711_14375 [Nocardia sp. CA2R105]|uniref:type VII secretion target n=1 Tax=Nocardia coffeae TaxID=2873381 RepID=UPI001CA701EB|nr:type VII secretion target [Nocardia coffeae]MBY8857668.1 hypothetical protein [Nocardia coffeae]
MSSDETNITPHEVASAGASIDTVAGEAHTVLREMLGSAQPASSGNPGFATGPQLAAFVKSMRTEIDDTITDLATAAHRIVGAAQALHTIDVDNAIGISRIASGLDSLDGPPG